MKPYSYDFRRVTDLNDASNSYMLTDIADYSYIMLAYEGYNYKIPTKTFIDVTYLELTRLNNNLEYLITKSFAQSREAETGDGNTSVEEEKYIHLEYVVNSTYNSETGEPDKKKFTILSYGDYSKLINNENNLNNNYYNTYYLSEGIATGELLNTYMSYSLDTLLGVPGTLTYITEAIDSISEFAAWFKDVQRDSSYTALISYITSNDNEIIESYTAAINLLNAKLNSKILELINSYTAADTEILNLYSESNSAIIRSYTTADMILSNRIDYLTNTTMDLLSQKQDVLNESNIKTINYESILGVGNIEIETGLNYVAGNNMSIDEDNNIINCYIGIDNTKNSINVGNTKYTLGLDNLGKLSLSSFTFVPFSVTVSGGLTTSHEYNSSVPASSNIALSATANKTATWGSGWIATSPATVNSNSSTDTTATAVGSYTAITKGTSQVEFTWTISATHNPTAEEQANGHDVENAPNKTVKVTHTFTKYKIFVFSATEQNINNVSIEENTNSQPITIKYNNQTVSNVVNNIYESKPSTMPTLTTPNSGDNRYIYLLIKKSWCNSSTPKIKWQSADIAASEYNTSSLGDYWKNDIKLYGNTTDYCLFVSSNNYPPNETFNITVS